ncbi:MAG TPA: hypothetical protein VI750_11775 [Pyrinomonadaceae bacterium]|nr:hypothetical protein [Pyrinomonadaceae bacterium]
MMDYTKNMKVGVSSFAIVFSLLAGGVVAGVSAQTTDETKPVTKRVKDTGRDPFRKYEPPRAVVRKNGLVTAPSIEERISQYKMQKAAAMNARMAAPKPTTALLLDEIQVVGISRTPRGYAAIVEATPIKLSYVVYPGERFYNGQLVAIEDNRLVFRREIVFADGRRDRSVELKALRQPNSVNILAATKTASAASGMPSENGKKAEDKPASSEKP